MAERHIFRSLPGVLGTLLLVLATTGAAITGTASLFYEGWGQPLLRELRYVAPAAALLVLGLFALRRPGPGAALLLVVSVAAGAMWVRGRLTSGIAPLGVILVTALVAFGPASLAALLLLFEARHRRLLRQERAGQPPRRVAGLWREALLIALPAIAVTVLSVQQLPALLARQDDGIRGARVVAGNGVNLVWAPRGPGWNWRTNEREYVSWDSLASHARSSLDRCAFLDEDGTTLLDAPARIWRMPTADEIVRSLTRNGRNAGCAWDGRTPHAECRTAPDKETPLWAPDEPPIYYWSSQAAGPSSALAVNYTGGISSVPRSWSSVGFRCVRSH